MGKPPDAPTIDEQEWLNVYIDPDLKQWVRMQAAVSGQSMSAWVSDLIRQRRDDDQA